MGEVSGKNFGLVIAYLLPGFVLLWTTSDWLGEIQSWFGACSAGSPTVGGFLHVTLASLAAGLTLSAIRWLLLDTLHHRTGVKKPDWDFSNLQANLAAFEGAVENHYRYYQFFGSMVLVTLVAAAHAGHFSSQLSANLSSVTATSTILTVLFFVASRDALRKYYGRTSALLGVRHTRKEPSNDERLASEKGTNEVQSGGSPASKEG
jgi:hypothetical protein